MSIESAGAYSPKELHFNLTSPFLNKMVHINAHPSSEVTVDSTKVVSLKNFIPSKVAARVNVEDITSAGAAKAKEINEGSFPPDPSDEDSATKLTNFSSKKIVDGALQQGYSYKEALVMKDAAKSYASASKIGVANILSTHAHKV